jgi:hypothetical protein
MLGLILVLALGSIGVAYGAWTQGLAINGNAATGKMDFQSWTGNDFLGATAPQGDPHTWLTHSNETVTPNVGQCSSSSNGKSHNVTISLSNVYPGYECYVWVGALNTGTVPIALAKPVFAAMPAWLEYAPAPTGDNPDAADYCYYEGYRVPPQFGQQCKMVFRVLETAPQDADATFTGSIAISQSTNAAPPEGHCFTAE